MKRVLLAAALAVAPIARSFSAHAATAIDFFFPALLPNAVIGGHVCGIPFQNSTLLLLDSIDAFKQAGLDPNKAPRTWAEWYADAQKLTKVENRQTVR